MHKADRTVYTLQMHKADRTVYTLRMHKADRTADKFCTWGNTLRKRKMVDKPDISDGRLHTHKADNGTADNTRSSHSMDDGT